MQCDVHRNADDASGQIPYLLDIQANLLSDLQTRVVVPLIRADSFGRKAARLHPRFIIDGQDVIMATHLIAAVRKQTLGVAVASLRDERDIVLDAIDVLWSGV
ncbi:MAG: toxin CcdB [Acetobacteraceae bacterium]|jgi:toxin CcdB|nr:toxin CcdB [Acetobacteraceae bacterium]